jgi:hypothetical protein
MFGHYHPKLKVVEAQNKIKTDNADRMADVNPEKPLNSATSERPLNPKLKAFVESSLTSETTLNSVKTDKPLNPITTEKPLIPVTTERPLNPKLKAFVESSSWNTLTDEINAEDIKQNSIVGSNEIEKGDPN